MFDRSNDNFKKVNEKKSFYTKPSDIIDDILFYTKYTEGFLSDLDYIFNSGFAAEHLAKKLKRIKQGDQNVSNNLLDYDLAIQILNYEKPEEFKNVVDILVGFLITTSCIEIEAVEEFVNKVNPPVILKELSDSIIKYYCANNNLFIVRDFFEEYNEYKYIIHRFRLFLELLDVDLSEFLLDYCQNNPFNAISLFWINNCKDYPLRKEMAVEYAYELIMFSPEYKGENKHDMFVKVAYGLINSDRKSNTPVVVFADLLKDKEADESKRYYEFMSIFLDAYKQMVDEGKSSKGLIDYICKTLTYIAFKDLPKDDEYWSQNMW